MKLSRLYEDAKQHPDPSKMTPEEAFNYARDVIKGRWPEGEPIIMQEPKSAYWLYQYARGVIKGRWPEAEPIIMQDPEWAYWYALHVIHDRWPEAEPTIKGSERWGWYQEYVMEPWRRKQEIIKRGEEYQKRTGKLPDEDMF